jgi:Ni/Co efflux regulator RcnB
MRRRILSLVIAMAIACAPVALEACRAYCELHEATSAASQHHQHAGHHPAMPSHHDSDHRGHDMQTLQTAAAAPSITGVSHACAHADDLPPASDAVLLVAPPPPMVASTLHEPAPAAVARSAITDAGRLLTRIVFTAPLRV